MGGGTIVGGCGAGRLEVNWVLPLCKRPVSLFCGVLCWAQVLHGCVHSGLPLWPSLSVQGPLALPMRKESLSQLTLMGDERPPHHTFSSSLAPDSVSSRTHLLTPRHLTAYPPSGWWLASNESMGFPMNLRLHIYAVFLEHLTSSDLLI